MPLTQVSEENTYFHNQQEMYSQWQGGEWNWLPLQDFPGSEIFTALAFCQLSLSLKIKDKSHLTPAPPPGFPTLALQELDAFIVFSLQTFWSFLLSRTYYEKWPWGRSGGGDFACLLRIQLTSQIWEEGQKEKTEWKCELIWKGSNSQRLELVSLILIKSR